MHKILEEKVAVVYQMKIKYGKKDKRKEMKCREDKTKSSVKDLQQVRNLLLKFGVNGPKAN